MTFIIYLLGVAAVYLTPPIIIWLHKKPFKYPPKEEWEFGEIIVMVGLSLLSWLSFILLCFIIGNMFVLGEFSRRVKWDWKPFEKPVKEEE